MMRASLGEATGGRPFSRVAVTLNWLLPRLCTVRFSSTRSACGAGVIEIGPLTMAGGTRAPTVWAESCNRVSRLSLWGRNERDLRRGPAADCGTPCGDRVALTGVRDLRVKG